MFVVRDFSQKGFAATPVFCAGITGLTVTCHFLGVCARKSLCVWVPFSPVLPSSEAL